MKNLSNWMVILSLDVLSHKRPEDSDLDSDEGAGTLMTACNHPSVHLVRNGDPGNYTTIIG